MMLQMMRYYTKDLAVLELAETVEKLYDESVNSDWVERTKELVDIMR